MPFAATDNGVVGAIREIKVDIITNHRMVNNQEVNSAHEFGSPEFIAQFDAYTADHENQYKTRPEWVVQDENRDAVTTEIVPYQDHYMLTNTWTMVGAVTTQTVRAESPYAPGTPEFDAWLNDQAQAVYDNWLRERWNYQPL